MVKFAHIADTHLGYRQYKLEEREKDFEKAFKYEIDKILGKKVDFVVHSGDLFNDGSPRATTLIFAIEQLKRLKENNIPFFVIPGSHDIRVEETIISVLEKVGLAINLASKERYEKLSNTFINRGYEFEVDNMKIFIAGLPGKRARIEELYQRQRFKDLSNYDYRIFVFHHTITEISTVAGDIPSSLLPKGFNYYAGGHWHNREEIKKEDKLIIYPGSSEWNDIKEIQYLIEKYRKDPRKVNIFDKKGFFIIDIDNKKRTWIEIPTRKFVYLEVEVKNSTPSKVTEILVDYIRKIPTEGMPVLYIKVTGKLAKGGKSEINRIILEELAEKRGFLALKLNLDDLIGSEEEKLVSYKHKTIDELEREALKNMGYSDREIEVIQELLKLLGRKYTNDIEKRAAIHKSIMILKELFEIEE